MPDFGKIAYEAYIREILTRSQYRVILPSWNDLNLDYKNVWETVAKEVLNVGD